MKRKRLIYEVRWDREAKEWTHGPRRFADGVLYGASGWTKGETESHARATCRLLHKKLDRPVQLLIYRKDGTIARGGRSEASYGCNSRARG